MTTVMAIIQARVGSNRLPGKVLMPLNGRPSICHVMERTAAARHIDKVVLATSVRPENDALEELATQHHWDIYRGSEEDVLSRFTDLAEAADPQVIVRVCADNFAVDPNVLDLAIEKQNRESLDLCNPFLDYEFPFGVGAEVISREALTRIEHACRGNHADYREHVTLWAYENPADFKFASLEAPEDCARPDISVSIDTPEDFERINAIYAEFKGRERDFTTADIISAWDRLHLSSPRKQPKTSR